MSNGRYHVASGAPALKRGAFVVSIDTELAWGEAHQRGASAEPVGTGTSPAGRTYDREREVIARILDILARRGAGEARVPDRRSGANGLSERAGHQTLHAADADQHRTTQLYSVRRPYHRDWGW